MDGYCKINNNGAVIGSMDSGAYERGWRWTGTGTPQNLGKPATYTASDANSQANGINDAGVIVGTADNGGTSHNKAIRFTDATGMQFITGSLGGSDTTAADINNAGVIVGSATLSTGYYRAYRYTDATGMQNLGTIAGTTESFARDINDLGWIDGSTLDLLSNRRPIVWTPDGAIHDINAWLDQVNPIEGAKWELDLITDINNSNIIVGRGTYYDGPGGLSDGTRGFVLDVSTLPEPGGATVLLIAPALALFARIRRTGK